MKNWLADFHQIVDKAVGNQHFQFTAEIWMNDTNLPHPVKEDKVQIVTNDEFPFLDMKIRWSPEEEMIFSVFRKKGYQLKYVGMGSIHTPRTLREIPSGVLNGLAKLAPRKKSF